MKRVGAAFNQEKALASKGLLRDCITLNLENILYETVHGTHLSDAALLAAEAGVLLAAVPHQPAVVVAEAVAAAGAAELEVA